MNMLHNETVLSEWRGKYDTFLLTTHRVRHSTRCSGASKTRSIMLDELASCSSGHFSNPILLVFAAVAAVVGVVAAANSRNGAAPALIGFAVAIVLVIMYFVLQRSVLLLESAGANIAVYPQRINAARTEGLVDQIEEAKNYRYFTKGMT